MAPLRSALAWRAAQTRGREASPESSLWRCPRVPLLSTAQVTGASLVAAMSTAASSALATV
eukprot:8106467-Lingulodinium_polyedra.AAC.1